VFNPFSGTIEAMGAVQSYKQLKTVVSGLANPKAAKLLKNGDYEVAGMFPGGAVYLFVRDRALSSVGDLAGKRISTLDFDEAAKVMVKQVGASMVAADVGTFSGMFNNGSVDACYVPASAYGPLELGKGLGAKGGIVKFPLAQLTLQVLVRPSKFPADFGQQSRAYAAKAFATTLRIVEKAEKTVPAKYWMDVTPEQRQQFDDLLREVRIRLRDKEKVYDKQMLSLLRKIRCKDDAARAECAEKRE
jgi:TRAP-type C4-dicarboxylate transport system substrate-binding protein